MSKWGTLKNAYIKVGNTDLSNHCTSLQPTYGTGATPLQAFGDTQEYSGAGLTTRGLTAKFLNDFAAASVFATLNPLKNGATHVIQYRHDGGTASATNPTYSGLWFISNITGLVAGDMGGPTEVNVTWTPAGQEAELTT